MTAWASIPLEGKVRAISRYASTGASASEIARYVGVTKGAVFGIVRRNNIVLHRAIGHKGGERVVYGLPYSRQCRWALTTRPWTWCENSITRGPGSWCDEHRRRAFVRSAI